MPNPARLVTSLALSAGLAAALAVAIAAGPAAGLREASAQERPGAPAKPEGGKPEPGKPDGGKPEMKAGEDPSAEMLRQDRAKKLVAELEIALAAAKAAKTPDPAVVVALETSLAHARKLAEPIALKDLTDEEKRSIGEELRKQFEGAPGGGGPSEWQKQALARAFDGAELSEEDEIKATEIISQWFSQSQAARTSGDSKKVSDLKRDRDAQLEKVLSKKKAQKVINNLNSMSNWGGRGGK